MDDVKRFWADAHKKKLKGPLTGTPYSKLMNYFDLKGKLRNGMNILSIGVGLGHSIRGFSKKYNVYALDICEEAIDSVRKHIVEGYLHENLHELPSNHFDIAYSLLVTGHMPEDDLLLQLRHVIRALKPDGKFYCQFSGLKKGENNIKLRTVSCQDDPSVPAAVQRNGRTVKYAKELVKQSGGKITFVSGKKNYPGCFWYYFIIEKA